MISRKERLFVSTLPTGEFALRCGLHVYRRVRGQSTPAGATLVAPARAAVPAEELTGFLRRAGIEPGHAVMVHSSVVAVQRLGWSPTDFIDLLLDIVGRQGTVLMPTHPVLQEFDGKQVYDPRRSPSRVGLVTELFRRRLGAVRSMYPLSSAAGLGLEANDMVRDHIHSFAPHDERSPYYKLIERRGKVLCVGVPLHRMTLIHVAEDVLRDVFPVPDFYEEETIWLRQGADFTPINVHRRADWLWWYLALYKWSREILVRGFAQGSRWGDVTLHVTDAQAVFDWMKNEILCGHSLYPLANLNRYLRLPGPSFSTDGVHQKENEA